MSIITISRGSYSRGKEVAEKLAERLGYECISREILLEASEHFHVPEIKLIRAIHDAPSILGRFTYGKERYVAYIREALLEHVRKDNVVYHGLAGHFFLQGIPHVLKVRITADLEDRVKEEMKRENISSEEARYILKKDDDERRKWSLRLYGIDTWDSSLYDIVLYIGNITANDAINILVQTAQLACFRTTAESQRMLDNLFLAAHVQGHLIKEIPTAKVSAKDGVIFVNVEAPLQQEIELINKINNIAKKISGVKEVKVHVLPLITSH